MVMRMAVDNLALSGSVIFDVDETALVGGQNMEIYPAKYLGDKQEFGSSNQWSEVS